MASPLAAEEPTFLLEFSNDVANLHDLTTVERSSVLDHVAVHVRVANSDVSGSGYEATCTTATCAVGGGTTSPCSRMTSMCI